MRPILRAHVVAILVLAFGLSGCRPPREARPPFHEPSTAADSAAPRPQT